MHSYALLACMRCGSGSATMAKVAVAHHLSVTMAVCTCCHQQTCHSVTAAPAFACVGTQFVRTTQWRTTTTPVEQQLTSRQVNSVVLWLSCGTGSAYC